MRQFARAVKGVDLRSTAGYCAWVRTPQLTFIPEVEQVEAAERFSPDSRPVDICEGLVGLVVMTLALHARGPRFNPGTRHILHQVIDRWWSEVSCTSLELASRPKLQLPPST